MIYVGRMCKFGAAASMAIILISCSPKNSGTSSISIVLPTAQSNKVVAAGTVPIDFTKACFAINVTGGGLQEQSNSCSPSKGVFSGFKLPGSTISMQVPMGSSRKIEVYLFTRANTSDPCPADFSIPADKFVSIGAVDGIDMTQPTTNVTLKVADPMLGASIVTQLGLPAVCVASGAPTGTSGLSRTFGSQLNVLTAGGYKVQARVYKQAAGQVTTANGYIVILGPKKKSE